jgi:hypothetical protein
VCDEFCGPALVSYGTCDAVRHWVWCAEIEREMLNLCGRVSALLRYYNLIVALWDGEGWHRFAPLRRSAGPVAPGRAEIKLHVCRAGRGGRRAERGNSKRRDLSDPAARRPHGRPMARAAPDALGHCAACGPHA